MSAARPEEPSTSAAGPPGLLLTVGIPVFNGRTLLRNCLRSVVDSTLARDRFEIVVADDGSSEPETLAILAEFEQSLAAEPGFFRILSLGRNSGGAARPRNRILDEATGEYVFFIDSDDTIGRLALEKIADALTATPADWVALNQVAVNGRAAGAVIPRLRAQVPRATALTTLTVHKVFRRAEIERQRLRFDEGLPSGQDVAFAFAFLLSSDRFLMLGGYDYYHLTQHTGDPNEPPHLSRRAKTPEALLEKDERILRSMLASLNACRLPDAERRRIVGQVVLPRVLVREGHLKAILRSGPAAGTRALRRLARMLADPLVTDLDPADLKGLTRDHLAVVAASDWAGLARLLGGVSTPPRARAWLAAWWMMRGFRVVDLASGRARRRARPRTDRPAEGAADWAPSDPFVPHPKPTMTRQDLLRGLHEVLTPRTYLEIGVDDGTHLALSRATSIGVSPDFAVRQPLACDLELARATSDEFFADPQALAHFHGVPIDLAFVDGTHLAEYAVRDFINVERHLAPAGVVVLDDVLPRNALEAARVRRTGAWAGDVYKAVQVIARRRPDLAVVLVNTWPTGTAIVVGGDPESDVLAEAYPSEVAALQAPDPQHPPAEYLSRAVAVDPTELLASAAWPLLVAARTAGDPVLLARAVETLRALATLGEPARVPAGRR